MTTARNPGDGAPRPSRSQAGDLLTDVVVATLRLNGRVVEVAQRLAAAGGLTAAWWQVLGGVVGQPRTVADVARRMGMTRQGVQRVADLLVERGLAEYQSNPAHRRAKLLACTEAGAQAIDRIARVQHPWADRIAAQLNAADLRVALTTMQQLIATLEADER